MATPPAEPMARLAAHALVWGLWCGAWVVLGELGQQHMRLWAAGLLPVALWLVSTAVIARCSRALFQSVRVRARFLVSTAAATATTLVWSTTGGGAIALLVAAVAWGGLVVAVGAVVRGATTTAAWACLSGDDRDNWVLRSARIAMLPMMASLVLMADWCSSAGLASRSQTIAAHLVSMAVMPCLCRMFSRRPKDPAWVALPMGASVIFMLAMPGVQGWMAASIAQSLAWGLAIGMSAARHPCAHSATLEPGVLAAVASAVALCALGVAMAAFGPSALLLAHAALGLAAVAAAAVSILQAVPTASERSA